MERNDETNNENEHSISATLPGIKKVRIIFVYVVGKNEILLTLLIH